MPLIGFTMFKEKILNGEKRQTIRKARKIPIKVGDTLYLYWHLRQKDCELLKVVKCTEVHRVYFHDFAYNEETAKRDGFENARQMREWFREKHKLWIEADAMFDIIRW